MEKQDKHLAENLGGEKDQSTTNKKEVSAPQKRVVMPIPNPRDAFPSKSTKELKLSKLYSVSDTKRNLERDILSDDKTIKLLESKIQSSEKSLERLKNALLFAIKTKEENEQKILDLKPVEDKLSSELIDEVFEKDQILKLSKDACKISKKLNGKLASISNRKLLAFCDMLVDEPTLPQLIEKSKEIKKLVDGINIGGTIAQANFGKELRDLVEELHGTLIRGNYKPVLWKSNVDLDVIGDSGHDGGHNNNT